MSSLLAEDTLAAYSTWFSDPWNKDVNTPHSWQAFFRANDEELPLSPASLIETMRGGGFESLARAFGWAHLGEPLSRYIVSHPPESIVCAEHDLNEVSKMIVLSLLTGRVSVPLPSYVVRLLDVLAIDNLGALGSMASRFRANLLESAARAFETRAESRARNGGSFGDLAKRLRLKAGIVYKKV